MFERIKSYIFSGIIYENNINMKLLDKVIRVGPSISINNFK